jgi:hypothetical protein
MIDMLLLFVATVAVVFTAVEVSVLLPLPRPTERVMAAVLLAPVAVVVISLFTGFLLQTYRPVPILATAVALAVGVHLLGMRGERRDPALDRLAETVFSLLDGVKEVVRSPVVVVLAVVSLVLVLPRVALALRMPIIDYDGLYYHLLPAGTWVQHGAIEHVPPLPLFADVYPANGELLMGWSTLFRHDVGLVDLTQMPFALLGVVAVCAAARQLGLDRRWSATAGLLVLVTPILVAQLNTAYVDVMASTPLFAAFAWLTMVVADGRRSPYLVVRLGLAGAALGLAMGTKTSNLAFLLPAGLLVLWTFVAPAVRTSTQKRPPPVELGRGLAAIAAFVGPILLLAGFWCLRTWVEHGSPFHPFQVDVGPVTLVQGDTTVPQIIDNQMSPELAVEHGPMRVLRSWFEEPTRYIYDQRLGGLGVTFTFLMVPALLLTARALWERSRTFVLAFVAPLVVMLLLQPGSWWSRYTLWLVAPGAIALVFFASTCRTRPGRIVVSTVLVGAVLLSAWSTLSRTATDGELSDVARMASVAFGAGPDHGPGETLIEAPYVGARAVPDGAVVAVLEDTLALPFVVVGQDLEREMVAFGKPPTPDLAGVEDQMQRVGAGYLYAPPASLEGTIVTTAPDRFEVVEPLDGAGMVMYRWLGAEGVQSSAGASEASSSPEG